MLSHASDVVKTSYKMEECTQNTQTHSVSYTLNQMLYRVIFTEDCTQIPGSACMHTICVHSLSTKAVVTL